MAGSVQSIDEQRGEERIGVKQTKKTIRQKCLFNELFKSLFAIHLFDITQSYSKKITILYLIKGLDYDNIPLLLEARQCEF